MRMLAHSLLLCHSCNVFNWGCIIQSCFCVCGGVCVCVEFEGKLKLELDSLGWSNITPDFVDNLKLKEEILRVKTWGWAKEPCKHPSPWWPWKWRGHFQKFRVKLHLASIWLCVEETIGPIKDLICIVISDEQDTILASLPNNLSLLRHPLIHR